MVGEIEDAQVTTCIHFLRQFECDNNTMVADTALNN